MTTRKPPHQNFSITVPSTLPTDEASLSVAHFSLIGVSTASFVVDIELMSVWYVFQVGLAPFMEVQNITLIVQ